MIKSKTLQKQKAKKQLPVILFKENTNLQTELDKSCNLIKEANAMIKYLQETVEKNKQEINELKKHWTHKIYNWFK